MEEYFDTFVRIETESGTIEDWVQKMESGEEYNNRFWEFTFRNNTTCRVYNLEKVEIIIKKIKGTI